MTREGTEGMNKEQDRRELTEQFRSRKFVIIEDYRHYVDEILMALKPRRGVPQNENDPGIQVIAEASKVKLAIDRVLGGCQGGETITLIADLEIPETAGQATYPFLGPRAIRDWQQAVKDWGVKHQSKKPVRLEVFLNSPAVADKEGWDHFQKKYRPLTDQEQAEGKTKKIVIDFEQIISRNTDQEDDKAAVVQVIEKYLRGQLAGK